MGNLSLLRIVAKSNKPNELNKLNELNELNKPNELDKPTNQIPSTNSNFPTAEQATVYPLVFLPFIVRGTFKAHLIAAAVHIIDITLGKALRWDGDPGVGASGKGVYRDLADVLICFQVLEAIRVAAVVSVILVNGVAQDEKGAMQVGFLGTDQGSLKAGQGHSGQDTDDGDNDHHFDQGVPLSIIYPCVATPGIAGSFIHDHTMV